MSATTPQDCQSDQILHLIEVEKLELDPDTGHSVHASRLGS